MKDLIRLKDMNIGDIYEIFRLADEIAGGGYSEVMKGKTAVMFFPETSLRTRVSFEKGIHLLGGQTIIFPPATLDKREDIRDVCGYLNNWADIVIVRHRDRTLIEKMAEYLEVPVINAMTDADHPCEILTDLYA